jgi:oxygen-independent coproporphyrinogen-3 oxidase
VRGLYVHVPFCVSKCAYCDFYSLANRLDLIRPYVDAVLTEAQSHAGMSFDTLYLGGGTPSLLGAADLEKLIRGLKDSLDLSRLAEATIEVNPESASEELLRSAMDLGFSRVSVGIQSLSDRELRSVGRVHTAAQAVESVSRVVGMGFRDVSADVIVGLPGQMMDRVSGDVQALPSPCLEAEPFKRVQGEIPAEGLGVSPNSQVPPQDWGLRGLREASDVIPKGSLRRTLETLISLGVNHLSVYCLSLEHGTPLATNPPDDLPSDDEQADLFEGARSVLEGWGFTHYEISNFCLPGKECRHNLNYWRGGEYLGLGPASASHLQGRRWKNRADLPAYIRNPAGVADEVEELGFKDKAAEEAMLRLRLLAEGLAPAELATRFGEENTSDVLSRLNQLAAEGLLAYDGTRYRLMRSMVLTSNPIFGRILG